MNNTFRLKGFINTFNVSPGFVTPVFENINQKEYVVQYIKDNKILLDTFSDFSDSFFLSKIEFYRISDSKYEIVDLEKKNLSLDSYLYDLEKPIFGFQTEKRIFYGRILAFMNFLNDFETDDVYLKEEISDFKENIAKLISDGIDIKISLNNKKNPIKNAVWADIKGLPVIDSYKVFNGHILRADHVGDLNETNRQLEDLDRQLKNTHFISNEYANLIAEIYALLLDNGKECMRQKDITKKF